MLRSWLSDRAASAKWKRFLDWRLSSSSIKQTQLKFAPFFPALVLRVRALFAVVALPDPSPPLQMLKMRNVTMYTARD
jgi:hypothetical protein